MPSKSVTLSVRITDEDADFLAGMSVPGATTPSEKIRTILSRERKRQTGTQEFANCAAFVEEMLAPAILRLRKIKNSQDESSSFASKVYDWAPELLATLIVKAPSPEDAPEELQVFETRLATHIFELIEDVLQMALPGRNRNFAPDVMEARLNSVLSLALLVQSMKSEKGEQQ